MDIDNKVTYYASTSYELTIKAGGAGATIVVKSGATVTVKGDTAAYDISFAVGEKNADGDLEYDANTLIGYKTNASETSSKLTAQKATSDATGYFGYTADGSNAGTVQAAVVAAESASKDAEKADVKLYGLNAVGVEVVLVHTTNDSVQVIAPENEEFTTDITVTYETDEVRVAAGTSKTATNLKVDISTTDLHVAADETDVFDGKIAVVFGKFLDSNTDGSLDGKIDGVVHKTAATGVAPTWYPLTGADITVATDGVVEIPSGVETGEIVLRTAAGDAGVVATIPEGFRTTETTTAQKITLTYTAEAPTVTIAGYAASVADTTDWTGAMTVADGIIINLGKGNLGSISGKDATLGSTSTNVTTTLYGTLDLSGNLTLDTSTGTYLVITKDADLRVGGQVVCVKDEAGLKLCEGATLNATMAAGEENTKLVGIEGLRSISTGQQKVINGPAALKIDCSWSEGKVSAGDDGPTKIRIRGIVNEIKAPGVDLNLNGETRVVGDVEIGDMTTNAKSITFTGKQAKILKFLGCKMKDGQELIIGKDTTLTIEGKGAFHTFTGGACLKILGKMVGGKITDADATKVFTADGSKTPYLNGVDYSGDVGKAEYTTTTAEANVFADFEDAIGTLGFKIVKLGAAMTVTEDYEIASDVTVYGAQSITVASGKTLAVRGAVYQSESLTTIAAGAAGVTLEAGTATTAGRTVLNNQGTMVIGTSGLKAGTTTYMVNSGTMSIGFVGSNPSEVLGLFENSGVLNLANVTDSKLVIGADRASDGTLTAAELSSSGEINMFVTDIEVKEGSVLSNRGKIDSSDITTDVGEIYGKGTFDNQGDGKVGVAVNTVRVTGVTSTVKVENDMTQKITYMSLQSLEVPEGANLKLTSVAKIGVNGKMTINGTLTIEGTLTVAAAVFDAQAAELVLNGKIVVADGGQLIIGGSADESGLKGSGSLTVNSAGSVTVQNGGKLTIRQGYASVSGSLTMDTGSELTVDAAIGATKKAGYLSVYGTADLNGYLNGNLTISDYGTIAMDNGYNAVRGSPNSGTVEIDMAAGGAVLTVDTYLMEVPGTAELKITDSGLCTYYDSKDYTKSKYIPSGNSDVITIGFDVDSSRNGTTTPLNKVVVDGSLVIKQSASYKTVTLNQGKDNESKDKQQNYSMDISGEIAAAYSWGVSMENATIKDVVTLGIQTAGTQKFFADKTVKMNVGGVNVSKELDLGQYVTTAVSAVNSGVLTVSGSVSNDETGAQKIAVSSGAKITVTGSIDSSNLIDVTSGGKVNAVYYATVAQVEKTKVTTHHYTTLDKAIEGVQDAGNISTDKVVKIIGSVTLKNDVVLPETVGMQFYDTTSSLTIGTSAARAVLTAESAVQTLTGGQIAVNGTLVFVDKADDKTSKTVSDVMYESGDVRTYTNIYTAIEQAGQASEAMTITVTKEAGTDGEAKVELDQNLNIPSNVTLVIGNEVKIAGLKIMDGVTLTIDGTVQSSQEIIAEHRFAVNAMDVEASSLYSSAVVVNGKLMIADSADGVDGIAYTGSDVAKLSANANIYGAYYSVDGWYVVSNIDDALAETGITSSMIDVYGPVRGSDATVTANDVFSKVVVNSATATPVGLGTQTPVETQLTMNSLTLDDDTSIVMDGRFTGTVKVEGNAVDLARVSGITAAENDWDLVLTGTVEIGKEQAVTISSGTVVLGSAKAGFCSDVDGDDYDVDTFADAERFAVRIAAGAAAEVGGTLDSIFLLVVDGTFEVPAGTSAVVYGLHVDGSVKVGEATSSVSAGSLTVYAASIGMTSDDFTSTGASASVTGPVELDGTMIVASGATVSDIDEDWASTGFYNGGSLWFTAYAGGNAYSKKITVEKAPLTNAVLSGWAKTEGGEVAYATDADITIGEDAKLYAVVETDIYKIVIKADTGIGDLYLNGNIMQKGDITDGTYTYSAYWATVSAGTYEVTCKLANGFKGTPVLKDAAGTTVSANKITVSGTPAEGKDTITSDYQLTGVTASGYVEPVEPEEKDDGMTVTDYLLIVLVILVVVLAVIVALKLLRS